MRSSTFIKLKEPVRHGSSEFPYQLYKGFFNRSSMLQAPRNFASHWHEEMEILWFPKDAGRLMIDGETLLCEAGTVFFIHPGEIHSWESSGAGAHAAVVFDWRLLELLGGGIRDKFLQPLSQGALRLPRSVRSSPGWKHDLCRDLEALAAQPAGPEAAQQIFVIAKLFGILSRLAQASAIKQAGPDPAARRGLKIPRIKRALQEIYDHYPEPIGISRLAKSAGMSRWHFCRQFKLLTGQTPMSYLNRHRIEEAAELLKNEKLSVLDVSLDAGFNHFSYFIRTFRRFQHCTPSQYRMRLTQFGKS